ncbi:MAG TPA: mechanosensitive ion channel family protein [Acidimicrobiales bacterium]|nr:mechanosensitive ion channel family protein [Acidimicrobiales bacterium]
MPPLDDFTQWARTDGLQIPLLGIGAVLLTRLAHWLSGLFAMRVGEAGPDGGALAVAEEGRRRAAVAQALERTVVALVWFIVGVMVLSRLGIPITTLVAPATVAGVALGFGAQRVVQDVLAGFFIISENQYALGDLVQISQPGSTTGVSGTVEAVSLRTTQLRTSTGELVILPNGEARQVTNRSRDWRLVVVDAPIPIDADVDAATFALRAAADELSADETVAPMLLDAVTVSGVQSIELGYLQIRISARTTPTHAVDVGLALRRAAARALSEAGMSASPSFSTSEGKAEAAPAPPVSGPKGAR